MGNKSIEPKTKAGKIKENPTPEEVDSMYAEILRNIMDIETELIYEGEPLWKVAQRQGVRYWTFLKLCQDPQRKELHDVWLATEEKSRRVADSLYRSAIGGYYDEQQAFKVRTVTDYVNKKGQKCRKSEERIETVTVSRYLPPNVQAMQFYLTNRDPKEWKNELRLSQEPAEGPAKPGAIDVRFVDPSTEEESGRIREIEAKVREGR